jgi:hypothetical protein
MDLKEVLLLLGLTIEILRDLVVWLTGLDSPESVPDGIKTVAGLFVTFLR